MNEEKTVSVDRDQDEIWPWRLNKWLMGLGVLVFGLIIVDRVVETFQADDLTDVVETVIEPIPEPAESVDVVADNEQTGEFDASATDLEITEIFGSRLVFVSASEPMYVVTDDDRRIAVGDSIDDSTTLAGITGQRVVLEKAGELLVVNLPEPEIR